MNDPQIQALLDDLKNPDATVRDRATESLWRLWFQQKGLYGWELLQQAQTLFEKQQIQDAEVMLTELIGDQPDFAEAWNRRAVLHYTQSRYRQSLHDCQKVIELNPIHFGALHGMGLCYAMLGEYRDAISAFRRALEIQPYSTLNQRLLLECTARLS